MKPASLVALIAVFASPAFAECASPEATFMSCTFKGGAKVVEVCLTDGAVTYAFGPRGKAPELALSVPIAEADYLPWPGVSTVWESMTFHVDAISYVVSAGEHRIYPESDDVEIQSEIWGNIGVYENYDINGQEKELVSLECDKGSVTFSWSQAFSDAKQSVGQCWSAYDQTWQACE